MTSPRQRPSEPPWRSRQVHAWTISAGLHLTALAIIGCASMLRGGIGSDTARTGAVLRISAVPRPAAAPEWQPLAWVADRQGLSLKDLISTAVAREQGCSVESGVAKLTTMAQQLQHISSQASIQALGRHIRSIFPQSGDPAPTALAFGFDFSSAQFREIYQAKPGVYHAVLRDQFGNEYDTHIDAATARQVEQLLKLMDEYPLLRTVYEDIVCRLLNQTALGGPPA